MNALIIIVCTVVKKQKKSQWVPSLILKSNLTATNIKHKQTSGAESESSGANH